MRTPRFPPLAEIRAPDGARITIRALARPDAGAPVVVVLPAMGMAARHYTPLVRSLHAAGLTVATCDLRGHGESRPVPRRGVRFGYREIVEHDIKAVLDAVAAAFPAAPLLLLGHSLGGQLGMVHCGVFRPRLAGAVLVASGSAWFRTFGPLAGLYRLTHSQFSILASALLGHWPGERLGFGGRESARLMRDWARQMRTGRYRVPGACTDYDQALADVELPVLAVDVANDALAPPRAVDHLCDKMPRARVERWSYTVERADGRPLDHFRWIRHNRGLVEVIARWVFRLTAEVERSSGAGRSAEVEGAAEVERSSGAERSADAVDAG
ncbi:alpha/beta fold hydrolase [Streptomyces sp. SL13]|uniref:Alpha/beta fold hydrolase n=1 Tax=Streptantibioticus silvisoli TaxID=2705255 RepID=A0AA90H7T7_9ACTN|nr:alpha/beta fold hydrolase [Streptantibioticus silvisoli]MDI5969532.1 alpha/beta fold hydrolase [Streptantibioticus silvisoli]